MMVPDQVDMAMDYGEGLKGKSESAV